MQILLSDKSQKPAGELQVGDEVRTAHEKDFTIGNYKVTRVEIVDSPIVKVNFEGKSITCSPSHKFYSETDDTWTSAKDLKEDDRVSLEDGEITFVSRQQMPDGKVVSITVDDAHTYICEGFLSHNKTPIPELPEENRYEEFINRTYNDLLGRDAGEEGLTYWSGDLEGGQTEQQVIDNIKRGDEYQNREMAKDLASSMEGKTYGRPIVGDSSFNTNASASLGNINENSLDAWVGAGGSLTQSSDADAAGYYEGVGDKEKASLLLNSFSGDLDDDQVGLPAFSPLDDRQEKIYDLYQNVFGRNPDEEGLKYWTGAGGEGMSLDDIEASFKGSAEQKLRDNVSGTNNFVSTDDYIAGKQNRGVGESGATNEDRSSANVSGTADNFLANTNNVTISPSTGTNTSNTGPNPTISTSNAPVDELYVGPVASSSTSTEADTFLNNLYADLGINDGVVDEGGRNYWTEQLKNKSKAEVERDIKWAAANN
jgi:hypothetical protein